MKTCNKCNIEKPLNDFYRRSDAKDGYRNDCKSCKNAQWKSTPTHNERMKKYYKDNPDKRKVWKKNNPDKVAANVAARRARKHNQTPDMFDDEKRMIKALYKEAQRLTQETGIVHEIDHIHPISQGGLHCYLNLQILTQEENRRKGDQIRA